MRGMGGVGFFLSKYILCCSSRGLYMLCTITSTMVQSSRQVVPRLALSVSGACFEWMNGWMGWVRSRDARWVVEGAQEKWLIVELVLPVSKQYWLRTMTIRESVDCLKQRAQMGLIPGEWCELALMRIWASVIYGRYFNKWFSRVMPRRFPWEIDSLSSNYMCA